MGITFNIINGQSSVKLFTNNELGLTLEYPSNWVIDEQQSNYQNILSSQIFFVPQENMVDDALISFSVLGVGNYTLDEYSTFSSDLLKNNRNVEDIGNGITSSSLGSIDTPALNLTYITKDQTGNRLYIQEISAISNEALYTATLIIPEEAAKQLVPVFKDFVSSIVIA